MPAFRGRLWFCSNFYPCKVEFAGRIYDSSEAAFQAAKVPDLLRYQFLGVSPYEAKRLGRMCELPRWWEDTKLDIMESILRSKFQDKNLRRQLLNTNNEDLVEENDWGDSYWGVCNVIGENHLGKLLMKIRQELKEILPIIEE